MEIWQEVPCSVVFGNYAMLSCVVLNFGSLACWLLTLWLPLFAIPPSHSVAPIQPKLCHVRFLVGCMFSNGATISDLRCRDETKSLLWVHTQGCATRHALVSRFLVMIHCRTALICYFHRSSSLVISPYRVRRSVCRTRYHRTSF